MAAPVVGAPRLEEEHAMRVLDPARIDSAGAVNAVSAASAGERPGATPVNAPMRELLAWVARCPRTYGEAMEAWRSSCPRYSVWEDALDADLVRIERADGTRIGEARVTLTPGGQAVLNAP